MLLLLLLLFLCAEHQLHRCDSCSIFRSMNTPIAVIGFVVGGREGNLHLSQLRVWYPRKASN